MANRLPSIALLLVTVSQISDMSVGGDTCWHRLQVLQAVLEKNISSVPAYLLVRVYRDRERAISLCRSGNQETSAEIIEESISDLPR